MDIEEYAGINEAAQILGVSKNQIKVLCRSGKLPGAVKHGGIWMIPRQSLHDYTPGPQGFAVVWARRREK